MSPDSNVEFNPQLEHKPKRSAVRRRPFSQHLRMLFLPAPLLLLALPGCGPEPQEQQPSPTPVVIVVTATPDTESRVEIPAIATSEPVIPPSVEPPAISTPQRQETPPVLTSDRPFALGKVYRSPLFETPSRPEGDVALSPVSSDQIFAFAIREAICTDGSKEQIVAAFLIRPESIIPDRNFSQTNQLGDLISAGVTPNGQVAGEIMFRDTPPLFDTPPTSKDTLPTKPGCKGKRLSFQAVLDQVRGRSGLGKIIGELFQRVRKGDNPPEAYIGLAEQYCSCKIPAEPK